MFFYIGWITGKVSALKKDKESLSDLLVLALITGALVPIQASTNATFSKNIGNPLLTGVMVFMVGLAAMITFALLLGAALPTRQQLATTPWHSYLGGLIVAAYVVMITVLVPRIGVGTSIGFIVTGQIISAIIIDHFGFLGVRVYQISAARAAGLVLMIAGIYLVMKK